MAFINRGLHIGGVGGFELEGGDEINEYESGGVSYRSHTWLNTGTLTAAAPGTVDVMVVSGGGGSPAVHGMPEGGTASGAAGAGGMVVQSTIHVNAGSGQVVVGGGGAASTAGQASSLPSNILSSTPSIGGARGSGYGGPGTSGGSGGGAGAGNHGDLGGGAGTPGQGNPGGSSTDRNSHSAGFGGSGGGAGTAGPGPNTEGGDGLQNAFRNGTNVFYAGGGGGGGGVTSYTSIQPGGQGGGGGTTTAANQPGGINTGGGSSVGGTGGSGIVIVRYNVDQ